MKGHDHLWRIRSVKPFQLFIPGDKCMDLPDQPLKRMERHSAISGKGDHKHVSGLEERYVSSM
jgi:hypothetical protein